MPVLTKCHECGKTKACTSQPSTSALINFFYYRPQMSIYICDKCEEKRAKKFKKMLENIK